MIWNGCVGKVLNKGSKKICMIRKVNKVLSLLLQYVMDVMDMVMTDGTVLLA